jgi:imidazolonepropionase-like amidohydrolase
MGVCARSAVQLRGRVGVLIAVIATFVAAPAVLVEARASDRQAAHGAPVLVIAGVAVFDPDAGFLPDRTVVVHGDRIIDVVSGSYAPPRDARVVDGRGHYLLPGLWDAHVHYHFTPGLDHESMAKLFLVNGITSVRDTGGHLEALAPARAAAAEPGAAAPRLYVAGPLLDDANRVYAGTAAGFPDIATGLSGPAAAAVAIDDLARQDVDLIKTYELVTPEVFGALIERAADRGLSVTAHIPLAMDGLDVAASGIRGMEHLRNIELACARDHAALLEQRRALLANPEGLPGWALRRDIHAAQRQIAFETEDPARCAEVIAALAEHRVFQTPTLTITSGDVARLFADPAWRETFDYLPHAVGESWRQSAAERLQTEPAPLAVMHTRWAVSMLPRLHAAGVPIMAGTDTPIGLLTPGFSLHEELRMLVEAGMPAQAVLVSATLRPAEFLGIEAESGTIAPGRYADLLLLDADPLADIRNTRRIQAVVRGGRLFDRAALDDLLGELEQAGRAP